ncbi:hypothetical protein ACP4OV_028167 [Aristida adscensionis]
MEKLLHLTPSHTSIPDGYAFPPGKVPPASAAAVSLPVIDLSLSRDDARRAVLDAGKELGFFQVINHGVPEELMRDMEAVCQEFFQLPAADKAEVYSEDRLKPNRLFTNTILDTGGEKYWRDCLRLQCAFPDVGDSAKGWPDKPQRLREVTEKYTTLARGVAMELLRLLSEGMGLRPDYFEGDLSGGDVILHVNHYPACPDPSLTLGQPPHCDRGLITVLLPSMVHGLEIVYKGDWIKIEPVPNAFVVNFGSQLEIVTNGVLKSIEHRATTNSAAARTSVATFIMPNEECLIGPAEEFVSEDNPACYHTVKFGDFRHIYNVVKLGSSINLTTKLKDGQKEK